MRSKLKDWGVVALVAAIGFAWLGGDCLLRALGDAEADARRERARAAATWDRYVEACREAGRLTEQRAKEKAA